MSQADAVNLNLRALRAEALRTLEGGEKPVAFNVVPHIYVFLDDGRTKEEWKVEVEIRRILGLPDLPVAVTCVRMPVFVGHAEAVSVELKRPLGAEDALRLLADAPGVRVLDEPRAGGYATPLDAAGTDPAGSVANPSVT